MKEIIKKVFTSNCGSCVKGTHFTKGDYIPTEKSFMGITDKGRQFELDRSKILDHTGGTYLTMSKLIQIIGEEIGKFKK